MVFDPTFHEISEEADELPDLDGTDAEDVDYEEVVADDLPPVGDE